jgi:hypothetical protein
MFAKTIIDSDAFIDMPLSTQALYFHLSMRADDDGFINNPKKIQRMIGASDDDLKVLCMKRYILPFDSGVVVIKHWKIHNYIQKDRYKPTVYIEEKATLELKANGSYTECIQDVSKLETQDRLELGENRSELVEVSIEEETPPPPPSKPTRHKYGMYKNVLLSDEDYIKLQNEFPHDYTEWIERLSEYIESSGKSYKSHLATIRVWAKKDKSKQKESSSNPFLDRLQNGE